MARTAQARLRPGRTDNGLTPMTDEELVRFYFERRHLMAYNQLARKHIARLRTQRALERARDFIADELDNGEYAATVLALIKKALKQR